MFSKLKERNIRIFFAFLLLSFFIWLLMEFAKEAVSQVSFKVEYVNMPTYKMFKEEPITELKATVKGTGFSLLDYKLNTKKVSFDLSKIDLEKRKFSPKQYITKFPNNISLLEIYPDSIPIVLESKRTKKVPVRLVHNIKYRLGYHLVGDFVISPDSIIVSGVDSEISSITEVTTELLEKNKVYQNINEKVTINKELKRSSYSDLEVTVKGIVDKTTEGKVEIPIKFINVPDGIKIIPFPKEILVTYQTNLSNFRKVKPQSFQIVCDYNDYAKDTSLKYIRPIIVKKSEWVSSLKITPSEIEFLIQK
ncbi:MAG: hypothetical protein KGV44_01985 [Flavobacteriaceae bacterium]|nr:hypothetical protein [Flavobacteriaceae bacterium]